MRSLRSTLAWLTLCLTVDVSSASAQNPDRVYKIVSLWTGAPGLVVQPAEKWTGPGAAYREGLSKRGYVLGKNTIIEVRHAEGDVARLATVAEALVASNVDVIVPAGTAATVAAMNATKTIPIVFSGVGNPVQKGIVASLAKPGGNVTGTSAAIGNPRMWQVLHDISPATRRAAYLIYGPNNFISQYGAEYRADLLSRSRREAAAVGIELVDMVVETRDELERRLDELGGRGDAAIYVVTDPVLFSWRGSILEMASRHRLPTVCAQWLDWAKEGCLATYGEDPYELRQSIVGQIDKVLRGIKPADIPVEQPTKFKLIINAKTARALELTLPLSILGGADEVID